jgi:acyl dehydratase
VEFSAGTQDPNPVHLDEEFAKGAGYPGILQQGPMTTGHFTRLLEEKIGQGNLTFLDVHFTAPVFTAEPLQLSATVMETLDDGQVVCALACAKEDGTKTAHGEARFRA